MALFHTKVPKQFGIVERISGDGLITAFTEKPESSRSDLASAAMFVTSPKIVEDFPNKNKFDFSKEILSKYVGKMYGYLVKGFNIDVGTLEMYKYAQNIRRQKMKNFRKEFIKNYLEQTKSLLEDLGEKLEKDLEKITDILIKARDNKKTVFIMGNGGSASTASHFAGDLSKGTIVEGFPRFKAIALVDNIPSMLAWANDSDYEYIFLEQLKNLMEPEDIVIGISGSGNSQNVINAIEYANTHGAITIGFSGFSENNKLMKTDKINIHVPSSCMQRVEDIHLLIGHLLTLLIREDTKYESK